MIDRIEYLKQKQLEDGCTYVKWTGSNYWPSSKTKIKDLFKVDWKHESIYIRPNGIWFKKSIEWSNVLRSLTCKKYIPLSKKQLFIWLI